MNGLREGKYIFCVSPGRSGTHYLSKIFDLVPGVCSVHEPEHQFSKYSELKPHNWNLKKNLLSDSFVARKKLKFWQINDLMNTSGAEVYVETNPMFCTLWHDVLLSENSHSDITVIILRRNSIDVLKSILDLGWYSERNGDDWMVSAYSVNSLLLPPLTEARASPMDIVSGYLINVELYTQKITSICKALGHNVIEICSTDLFGNVDLARNLLSMCALEIDDQKTQDILQNARNKPTIKKKNCNVSVEMCAEGLSKYLLACEGAGLKAPSLFF